MSSSVAGRVLAAGLVLSTFAWCAAARGAATLTVTDLGDDGSPGQLRGLINAAAAGDTIVLPPGTITLAALPAGEDANAGGDLDIAKDLSIQGAGAGATIIDGGAIDGVFDILATGHVAIAGVTIRNGFSVQAGGGGVRNFGTLELADSVVSGNLAERPFGGGAFNFGGGIKNLGTLTLRGVTVTGNAARGDGGGVYNEKNAVMSLVDVTVSGNHAQRNGGGILNFGTAVLTGVTVSGNNADLTGGGVFTGGAVVTDASATLVNVTVSGNNAGGLGGGLYNSATAVLTNVTVSGNGTTNAGSGIANAGAASLRNVLLDGNTSGGVDGNCSGTITSLGHNLDSGASCALTGPGDMSDTVPNLGPLRDNTGSTFTQALLAGSPAIDAGSSEGCPPTDQRGVARPQGSTCDIGAFEAASGAPAGGGGTGGTGGAGGGTGGTGATAVKGGGCGYGAEPSLADLALAVVALWTWRRRLRLRASG